MTPREFATYQAALTCAFAEEVSGAAYFAALAERHSGQARTALQLMSKIEAAMVRDLTPLIKRHGFTTATLAELEAQGRAEAATEADWPEFTRMMAENYGNYVVEFQSAQDLAPLEDRPVLQRLIDHELALIAFAQAERAGYHDPLAFLQTFLAKTA